MRTPAGTSMIDYARAQSEYWTRILRLLEEIDQLIDAGAPRQGGRPPAPPAQVADAIRKAARPVIHYPANGELTTTGRIRRVLHMRGPMTCADLTAVLVAEGWQTASEAPRNVVSMALSKGASYFRIASPHGVRPKVYGLKRPPKAGPTSAAEIDAAMIAEHAPDVTEAERKPS